MVSLGTYPATSLKAARAKRSGMHTALESGRIQPRSGVPSARVGIPPSAIDCNVCFM